jgi:hypothetical protein
MSNDTPDAGIPLLTEIIPSPVGSPSSDPVPVTAIAGIASGGFGAMPAKTVAPMLDNEDWSRLERELRERIVQQLRAKIDTIIEQRVQENLSDMLQIAVESIAMELRSSLHQVLSDTVSEAVAAELSSLKPKN